jgi:hypothetical protein
MKQLKGNVEDPKLDALHRRLAENSLGGHWQTRERVAKLQPYVCSWSTIYSCLMESGEVVKLGHVGEAAPAGAVLETALASKYVEEGACDRVLCYRPAGVEKFGTLSGGAVLKVVT